MPDQKLSRKAFADKHISSISTPLKADRKKAHGVHYTPPDLANFLAAATVEQLKSADQLTLLDPACGDGVLLLAFAKALPEKSRNHLTLIGYETDAAALKQARSLLSSAGLQRIELYNQDFLSLAGIDTLADKKQFSLFDKHDHLKLVKYDAIIANPPYVRTQVMGSDKAQMLAQRFGLSGRVDLYHAFTMAMANVLKPGGILGLLTSNRFLTVRSGASIRHLLRTQFDLQAIYDLGDTKLFSAAVLPVIVVARRANADTQTDCAFDRVYKCREDKSNSLLPYNHQSVLDALRDRTIKGDVCTSSGAFHIERGFLEHSKEDDVWSLSTLENKSWLHSVRLHQLSTFEDIAYIRVGIKTTADEVFIRSDWPSLPPDLRPETALLHPLITHHEAQRWVRTDTISPKSVLYPHITENGKRYPIDLSKYPHSSAYLNLFRERLTKRKYVIEAGRQWYEIWVPHDPDDWRQRKLVYPDISEFPRFFLDNTGSIVNGDCYWITLKEGVDPNWILLMLAVANSSFITTYYDVVFHNKLYAGRRRFMTQYVKSFPLPNLKSDAAQKAVTLAKQMLSAKAQDIQLEETIDQLIWKSFGLVKKRSW
jgi:adenine-specific DNA-methyltransferase